MTMGSPPFQGALQHVHAQEGGTAIVDHLFIAAAAPLAQRSGARLLGRDVGCHGRAAIHALQTQQMAAIVDHGHGHGPAFLGGLGQASLQAVLHVAQFEGGFGFMVDVSLDE